jgi:hypothetical protein
LEPIPVVDTPVEGEQVATNIAAATRPLPADEISEINTLCA